MNPSGVHFVVPAIMQTFLPLPDFAASAHTLDRQRLGKQRIEAKQILSALLDPSRGWANHPATKMWRGYEHALARYGAAVCVEWRRRGYCDAQLPWFTAQLTRLDDTGPPPWLGSARFHASHRSNLLRKNPVWYRQYGWSESHSLPYVWPAEKTSIKGRR